MNRIFKLMLLVVLTLSGMKASGQEVDIRKSEDIVVLQGKRYYLHTVMPGQTLFSICKAYGVTVAEVKALNKKKDEALRLYEVIRIPEIVPFVQQDGKFYYHKVQPGETLYSIARLYDIKPKRLLKFNEEFQRTPLSIGSVVKLPLKEITLPRKQVEQMESLIPDPTAKQQTEDTLEANSDLQGENRTMGGVEKTVSADSLAHPRQEDTFPFHLDADGLRGDSTLRVALLLPLSANAYPAYQDSLVGEEVVLSPRTEQFLSFYEGMLLAVDSLKSDGYQIDLHVFDTERSSEKAHLLAEKLNQLQPDLVVGPVYTSVYKVIAEQLQDTTIPLVYPLSTRSEEFGKYTNFVQVNASLELVAENMLQWLDKQRSSANILYLDLQGTPDPEALTHIQFKERLLGLEGVRSFSWNLEEVPLESLRVLLLPDRENIIVLPEEKEGEISKVLPLLSALTDGYQLTVLGLPEWQAFTSIDHETFYKLNTKLFTYSYVDYSVEAVKRVAENYRKYFSTEPNTLVFKAFDMGLYLMKLTAQYRETTLEVLEQHPATTGCSKFYFKPIPNQAGKENNGFYIVNFASDYQLKVFNF